MKKNFKILLVLVLGLLLLTGCGKGKEDVDNRINLNAPEGIKVETFYSFDNSSLIVKLTNETSDDIKLLNVKANYPENNFITENEASVTILKANSTIYTALLLPIDDDFNSYIPNEFDVNITKEEVDEFNDTSEYIDQIKTNYNINDDKINLTIENQSGDTLGSVNALLVYVKDGKPIATDFIYAMEVEETYEIERDILRTGDLDNPKQIDYDNIELYVTSVTNDFFGYDDEIDGTTTPDDELEEEDVDEDIDEEWD